MKKNIHPKINKECVVTCACGSVFTTMSTLPSIMVDICSACHPLFTGTQKLVDTEGRIDKYNKKKLVMADKKEKASSTKKSVEKAKKSK